MVIASPVAGRTNSTHRSQLAASPVEARRRRLVAPWRQHGLMLVAPPVVGRSSARHHLQHERRPPSHLAAEKAIAAPHRASHCIVGRRSQHNLTAVAAFVRHRSSSSCWFQHRRPPVPAPTPPVAASRVLVATPPPAGPSILISRTGPSIPCACSARENNSNRSARCTGW